MHPPASPPYFDRSGGSNPGGQSECYGADRCTVSIRTFWCIKLPQRSFKTGDSTPAVQPTRAQTGEPPLLRQPQRGLEGARGRQIWLKLTTYPHSRRPPAGFGMAHLFRARPCRKVGLSEQCLTSGQIDTDGTFDIKSGAKPRKRIANTHFLSPCCKRRTGCRVTACLV